MFVLINCSYDGDTYAIFNELKNARVAFKDSRKSKCYHQVMLVQPNPGETFGFGSRGDFFGGEVIEEFMEEV
jgi:hypothetical protein